ncbi:hypothetical protein Acr_09g0007140 [Actinidia rufa]|uniref:Retrotransposon Copia-like N-terminal domain-containing protein n=1 Tax=Actinidia rufa TaxID=165716 RepID=A0A7J0F6D0_9ERIC|nr:hypothetical protein Acr_09g0007140 [Actinidia rufa]
MHAKSDPSGSISFVSSSSFVPLNSPSSSSWPQNLYIAAIWLNDSNYIQWVKSVEIYFIAKKQYKFLVDNPTIAKRFVRQNMRIVSIDISVMQKQHEHIARFLSGMPSSFDFVHAYLVLMKLLSLSEVFNRLRQASLSGPTSVSATRNRSALVSSIEGSCSSSRGPSHFTVPNSFCRAGGSSGCAPGSGSGEGGGRAPGYSGGGGGGGGVADGSILIVTKRTTLLIIVGIFMVVPLPIRLHFPLRRLPPHPFPRVVSISEVEYHRLLVVESSTIATLAQSQTAASSCMCCLV